MLSDRSRLLYDYFTQLFAQVTNPPLDAIREELVTSLSATIGPEANLLEAKAGSCRQILLPLPVIDRDDLAKLMYVNEDGETPGFKAFAIDGLFEVREAGEAGAPTAAGGEALRRAIEDVRRRVSEAIAEGANLIVLSDRNANVDWAPIPSLLLTAAVHHHLVREKTRTKVGLVIETGDAREVHHMALLIGFGAAAVNPYLALDSIDDMISEGLLEGVSPRQARRNYMKAACKGVLKVMSKMGISTVASYTGAQVFEAIGLDGALIDEYFTGTSSRIGGVGLSVLAAEVATRHRQAHEPRPTERAHRELEVGGEYQWRREGEFHLFNPKTVFKLQHATRSKRYDIFKEYTAAVDDQAEKLGTLRGLHAAQAGAGRARSRSKRWSRSPSIMARFSTGAMSYGSISAEAHETLAIAMNRLGGRSNTGEGGEDADRFTPDANGDLRRSAIKQVASGRFGVTSEYLVNADDLQIKISQGAKPGEGGQLAGIKIYPWIARTRGSTPGVGLISPPPHHDIYSIEDIAQLIHDLKSSNPRARVHVKLVAEVGVGTVAAGVAKAHSDVVLISGPRRRDRRGAADLAQARRHPLGDRPGRDAADAAGQRAAGPHRRPGGRAAEDRPRRDHRRAARRRGVRLRHGAARGLGLHHDARLPPRHLPGRDRHAEPGPAGQVQRQARVRRDLLRVHRRGGPRAPGLARPALAGRGHRPRRPARHRAGGDALEGGGPGPLRGAGRSPTCPADMARRQLRRAGPRAGEGARPRLLGRSARRPWPTARRCPWRCPSPTSTARWARCSASEISRRYGAAGLPDDTISLTFTGSAGQSFGAFVPRGVTMRLYGDANDYFGKGLSGGRLVVRPPEGSPFAAEEQIIAGNVILYGATAGEVFIRGQVGERFCVRNSGATAVVEGVGDHGCEYMTGGVVLVLGPTGRNFAAGMSGGIAYVYDPARTFGQRVNLELVDVEPLDPTDAFTVRSLVERHGVETESAVAAGLLEHWDTEVLEFVKVMPRDYRRILEATRLAEAEGRSVDEAVMEAAHG